MHHEECCDDKIQQREEGVDPKDVGTVQQERQRGIDNDTANIIDRVQQVFLVQGQHKYKLILYLGSRLEMVVLGNPLLTASIRQLNIR